MVRDCNISECVLYHFSIFVYSAHVCVHAQKKGAINKPRLRDFTEHTCAYRRIGEVDRNILEAQKLE